MGQVKPITESRIEEMTPQEEKYVHFASCLENLNRAWWILNEVKRSEGNLRGPAFQMALIEYAKPYLDSHGAVTDAKGKCIRYKLDTRHVPSTYLDLHDRLLRQRNQIHAHSDLTVLEAKVYVDAASQGQRAFIAQNVIFGAQELANIDLIIELIEGTLARMYPEARSMEAQLPPTT